MKALIIPDRENRALLELIRREFINERFDLFLRELFHECGASCGNMDRASVSMMLLMNKVIVHRVLKFYLEGEFYPFVRVLNERHFGSTVELCLPYVSEFFSDIVQRHPQPQGRDRFESETIFKKAMGFYIDRMYKEQAESFNVALMRLMNVCHEQIPRNLNLQRVELTPTLSPMLFYTSHHRPPNTDFY